MQTDPWAATPSLLHWFAIWRPSYCLWFFHYASFDVVSSPPALLFCSLLVLLQFFCISRLYSWMMHGNVLNFLPECQPSPRELLRKRSFICFFSLSGTQIIEPQESDLSSEGWMWPLTRNSLMVTLSSYFILGTVGDINEIHSNLGDLAVSSAPLVSFRWHVKFVLEVELQVDGVDFE